MLCVCFFVHFLLVHLCFFLVMVKFTFLDIVKKNQVHFAQNTSQK